MNVGEARKVIHRRRLKGFDLAADRLAIEKIDSAPSNARVRGWRLSPGRVRPRRYVVAALKQVLDQMTAGEPGRARDEGDSPHGEDVSSAGRTGFRSRP